MEQYSRLDPSRGSSRNSFLSSLPLRFEPSVPKSSLPFSEFCTALEIINENRVRRQQSNQIEVLTQLFKRVVDVALTVPHEKETNLGLEIYLVLKMLMPSRDHKTVYGMKTPRLLQIMSSVLKTQGRTDASAKIDQWLMNPIPQLKRRISASRKDEEIEAIIFTPELLIATLTSSLASQRSNSVGNSSSRSAVGAGEGGGSFGSRSSERGGMTGTVTIQDIGALCRSLSNAYFTINSHESDLVQNLENTQKEILVQATKYLTFKEWTVLTQIILKKVSLGVGPSTVLACIPYIEAPLIFPKKYDLEEMARICVLGSKSNSNSTDMLNKIECGVPFVSMTCSSLKSPYLMKWLFSREETLNKPLKPKDGRLLIHSSGEWFIPLSASRSNKKRFVNIQNKELTRNPTKRRYVLFMREFQKSVNLLNVQHAKGLVIHHTLSEEKGNKILMLLRSVSDAAEQGIEIAEEGDFVVEPREYEEDDEDDNHQPKSLRKQKNIQEVLRKLCNENNVHDTQAGKYKLYVSVTQRKPNPRTKKGSVVTAISSSRLVKNSPSIRQSQRLMNKTTTRKNDSSTSRDPVPTEIPDIIVDLIDDNSKEKLIVQTKYDGDRLQAHVISLDEVRLYTKWGKDVSELYSNVRDDLRNFARTKSISPCILDGEIIVINEAGNPLPWSDEKWRYNKKGEPHQGLFDIESSSRAPTDTRNEVATIIYGDEEEEEESEIITYVTKRGLQQWPGIGPFDKKNMQARIIKNARLCFMIFDIIMYAGKYVHERTCKERLEMITSREFREGMASMKHIQVIPNTNFITTVDEFLELIKETVKNKEEGLILKDPNMEYIFGKSKGTQKFKISGPDINALICGAGSSLSKNPRQWGLLTCVVLNQEEKKSSEISNVDGQEEEEEETGNPEEEEGIDSIHKKILKRSNKLISYVRIEAIEGDRPWKAMQIVMSLPSKIYKSQIQSCNSRTSSIEIHTDSYAVYVQWYPGNSYGLKWIPKAQSDAHLTCELYVSNDNLKDIQWFVNPLECHFGVSIRGDLRPIEKENMKGIHGTKIGRLAKSVDVLVPRHPVGRLEFAEFQMSTCDSLIDIKDKFEDAGDVRTCIDKYTVRRIKRLRDLPPKQETLEEIRRTLIGISDYTNNETSDSSKRESEWPQPTPLASMTINEFSELLQKIMNKMTKEDMHAREKKAIKAAFRKLEPEARLILAGAPQYSQWNKYKAKQLKIVNIEDANESIENGMIQSDLPMLLQRLKELKGLKRPVTRSSHLFEAHSATANEFIELALFSESDEDSE